mmetsp:Transcript_3384/g.6174  ORF Transcript_3384/g.6174 Transcript_3384/m.6174 type:complete len:98 (-) Transcript_3384:166-459(-)
MQTEYSSAVQVVQHLDDNLANDSCHESRELHASSALSSECTLDSSFLVLFGVIRGIQVLGLEMQPNTGTGLRHAQSGPTVPVDGYLCEKIELSIVSS